MNVRDEDGRPAEVLLVEDTPGDVRLTREAFRDVNQTIRLHVAVDGVEALAFLTTSDAESDIERSYQLLVNCYLSRPVLLAHFETLVRSINDFWLTKGKLPGLSRWALT